MQKSPDQKSRRTTPAIELTPEQIRFAEVIGNQLAKYWLEVSAVGESETKQPETELNTLTVEVSDSTATTRRR